MSFSLLQPLRNVPIAVVDVETTGASADLGDRIIEIGIVRIENGQIVRQYEQLIDPKRKISAGISAITGITNSMLEGQPTWRDVQDTVTTLLQDAAVLGHNVPFDLSFLRREFRRTGIDLPELFGKPPVFDTVRIARRRFGRGGNGLQRLAHRFGIFPPIAHRALADAVTTAGVFERLLESVGGWDISLCDYLLQQGGPVNFVSNNPNQVLLPLELEEALDLRGQVRMEYLDANDQRTQRVIEPLKVKRRNGEMILVAHCQLRNDQRTFKVDRIVSLTRIQSDEPMLFGEPVQHVTRILEPESEPAVVNDAPCECAVPAPAVTTLPAIEQVETIAVSTSPVPKEPVSSTEPQ